MTDSADISLKQIFLDHKGKETDKWSLYLDEYDRLFKPYRLREIQLLEIGVQNGGSLEIWAKYFIQAKKIIGCDIDENCDCLKYDDDRIGVIIGNANSDETENLISQASERFDIIIDDGSHFSSDIIRSFVRYFSMLNDGGLYVIEDLHASYWADYEGGLYNPYSAVAFLKRLVDISNFEHWRNNRSRSSILSSFINHYAIDIDESDLAKIHSVEFVNSMCIISKMPLERNELGYRAIVGEESCAAESRKELNNSFIRDIEVEVVGDDNLDVISLINETNQLRNSIDVSNLSIQRMEVQINELMVGNEHKQRNLDKLELLVSESNSRIEEVKGEVSRLAAYNNDLEQEVVQRSAKLKDLESEIENNKTKIYELQEEVVSYSMSASWKITRPLRKLARIFRKMLHV